MILSQAQCDELISWNRLFDGKSVKNNPSVPASGIYSSVIDYNIATVYRLENTQWFFDLIHEYLLDEYPLNSINRGKFFYCLEYTIGAKFKKHRDKDRERDWALIVGATLNKDFEGGKLLSYKPDGELATTQGELYKMNSETIHEVTEVTSGVRYSFVYFITYEELGVPKTAL